jgi:type II secretory pathway component PulF
MALYFYQGFSRDGKRASGYLDASSLQSVKEQLIKQQIYPTSIALAHQEARIPWWKRLFAGRVSAKEKILFTKQLAILLKAGVPLLQALELLTDYFEGQFQAMLTIIKDDVKEGRSLNEALSKYPKAFDSIYVQLVRAGEASGKLETILERLTTYLERQEEVRKRISAAMREPIIQLSMAVIVISVMMIYVVPGMAEAFAGIDKKLPASTEFVMALSNLFVNYYLVIAIGIILLVAGFMYWRSTKNGKLYIDRLMLRLPFVNYFAKTGAIVQFTQTLGILTESGVNLAESLDIVCKIIDNQVLADALNEARDKIIKQGKIAQYLKQTGIFPPIAIYLINTGEESGKLDVMLLTVAKNYEDERTERIDGLTAAISPAMLGIMGVIVGFIVMAIAVPLVEMSNIS